MTQGRMRCVALSMCKRENIKKNFASFVTRRKNATQHTVDFTCVRTLRVPCVRPCMYVDHNLQLQTTTELTATSSTSRTMLWKSVKLTRKNVLYALCHAKYGSSNSSEIDSTSISSVRCGQRHDHVFDRSEAHAQSACGAQGAACAILISQTIIMATYSINLFRFIQTTRLDVR